MANIDIDWVLYESEVITGLSAAVARYLSGEVRGSVEPLAQVSVITYPQHQESAIGFQTLRGLRARGGVFLRSAPGAIAPVVDVVTYTSPGDFDLRDFHTIRHASLAPLASFNFDAEGAMEGALASLEPHLVAARDRGLATGVFKALPRGERFWIGVNSARDWYDHVIELAAPGFDDAPKHPR